MSQAGLTATRELADRYALVVDSLSEDEWASPSACAGWSIQDLVAHASSNYQAVVSPPAPEPDASPMKAEDVMDLMVRARRDWTHEQVADELRTYHQPWLDALAALQVDPTASVEVPMSELGTYPLHSLADAFAFDLACHLYVDLIGPQTTVRRDDIAPLDDATLAPGIGWMLTGLPQMCPAVGAALSRPVGLRLTGPGGGSWTLQPGDPLVVEPGLSADAAAVVTSDAFAFMQWGTTRMPWRDHASLDGDADYAASVLDRMNVI